MIDLKILHDEHPELFNDSAKFKAYLIDLYPEDKGKIHILSAMLAENVMNLVKNGDSFSINQFYNKLEDNYGFDQSKMKECFQLFLELKPQETKSETPKSASKKPVAPETKKKVNKELKYPQFSEAYIRSKITSPKFLVRGRSYFQQGRVHHLTCNGNMSVFESDVDGSYDNTYHCILYITKNKLDDCECECEAYARIPGPCKHIVATMLEISHRRVQAESEAKVEREQKRLDAEGKATAAKSTDPAIHDSSIDNRRTVEQVRQSVEQKGQQESSAVSPIPSRTDTSGFRNPHQYPLTSTEEKNQESKQKSISENEKERSLLKQILIVIAILIGIALTVVVLIFAWQLIVLIIIVLIFYGFFLGFFN